MHKKYFFASVGKVWGYNVEIFISCLLMTGSCDIRKKQVHPECLFSREYGHGGAQVHGEYGHPVVKIGIPYGCLFSHKYAHPEAHIYVKIGILQFH